MRGYQGNDLLGVGRVTAYRLSLSADGKDNPNNGDIPLQVLQDSIALYQPNGQFKVIRFGNSISVIMNGLPTSATGLKRGEVWRDDNGFLRIV